MMSHETILCFGVIVATLYDYDDWFAKMAEDGCNAIPDPRELRENYGDRGFGDKLPKEPIRVFYANENECVDFMQLLSASEMSRDPIQVLMRLKVTPKSEAKGSVRVNYYTLIMLDLDHKLVKADYDSSQTFLHWFKINIRVVDKKPIKTGVTLAPYLAPGQTKGQKGKHRFVLLAYVHDSHLDHRHMPYFKLTDHRKRAEFDLDQLLWEHDNLELWAAAFFRVDMED